MKEWLTVIRLLVVVAIVQHGARQMHAKTIAEPPYSQADAHAPPAAAVAVAASPKEAELLQFKSDFRAIKEGGLGGGGGVVGSGDEPAEEQQQPQSAAAYYNFANMKLAAPAMQQQPFDFIAGKRGSIDDEERRMSKGAYAKYKRHRSPYGLVYKDGKPIGILEPISRVYEYQNIDDLVLKNPLNKRENFVEAAPSISNLDGNVKRDTKVDQEKYISAMNNLKMTVVGGQLKNKAAPIAPPPADVEHRIERKAEKALPTHPPVLKRDTTNDGTGGEAKLSAIENNLKAIISDLNTITDDSSVDEESGVEAALADELLAKREAAIAEDEDLDNGSNKIGISKETHANKRFDIAKNIAPRQTPALKQHGRPDLIGSDDSFEGGGGDGARMTAGGGGGGGGAGTNGGTESLRGNRKIADYRSEGESYIRQKRQQANAGGGAGSSTAGGGSAGGAAGSHGAPDGNDIVKGLETSGDLTVSGNKSPLASASAPVEAESKKAKGDNFEKRDKQAAEALTADAAGAGDYENRLQRNIQEKISEIKEEVKREIKAMKPGGVGEETAAPTAVSDNDAATAGGANLNENGEIKGSIQKRNLLERDNQEEFDMVQNPNAEALIPHVRMRRRVDDNLDADTENMDEMQPAIKKQKVWNEYDAGLNQIKSGETLKREDKNQSPQSSNGADTPATATDSDKRKREDSKNGKELATPKLGFPIGAATPLATGTLEAAPARATRSAGRAGAGAAAGASAAPSSMLDADKLEKLVKESVTLTESIKSERGARYDSVVGGSGTAAMAGGGSASPRIEVELHSGIERGSSPGSVSQKHAKNVESDSDAKARSGAEADEDALVASSEEEDGAELAPQEVQEPAQAAESSDDDLLHDIEIAKRDTSPKIKAAPGASAAAAVAASVAEKKQQFQAATKAEASGSETDEKSKSGDAAAVSDNSPAPAASGHEQKYKVYETGGGTSNPGGAAKLTAEAGKPAMDTAAISAEAKVVEIRTDAPEASSKLVDEGSKSSATSEGDKDEKEKSKSDKSSAEIATLQEDTADKTVKRAAVELSADEQQLGKQPAASADGTGRKIRQERKSEPNLSLEDMQELDSENNMRRKRRYTDSDYYYSNRDKRAQYTSGGGPNYIHFRNYRSDEDEADDESDEFDDDNFDDRTANMVRKRATHDLIDGYDDAEADAEEEDYETGANGGDTKRKRNANARAYVSRMNEDAYGNTNYLYDANGTPLNRDKRQTLAAEEDADSAEVAALHSGGPMRHHLAAIKDRNAARVLDGNYRRKRLEKMGKLGVTPNGGGSMDATAGNKNQMISGLSESDIFGGLPQSYEGELTRFKRVKRDEAPVPPVPMVSEAP